MPLDRYELYYLLYPHLRQFHPTPGNIAFAQMNSKRGSSTTSSVDAPLIDILGADGIPWAIGYGYAI